MSDAVTLVHDTRNPQRVTATKPATITQLKSQGYRVVEGDVPTGYAALTAGDLRGEISRRNEAREDEAKIKPEGRKHDDLVAALEADDAAQEKAAAEAAAGAVESGVVEGGAE